MNLIEKTFREAVRIITGRRRLSQSFNLLRYKLSKKRIRLQYKPIYLTILPIHRCNLSCRMCLTHSKEITDNPYRHRFFEDMTFEMFKNILRRFPEALAVGFMGNGEPLLNGDIFMMIDHAENFAKMRTAMITNGIILDEFRDKILKSALSEICISINGNGPEEYERMTGMSRYMFPKIIESSKALIRERNARGSKLKISASIIVDRKNFGLMQKMTEFAKAVGFDHLSLYNILPLTRQRAEDIAIFADEKTLSALRNIRPPAGSKMTVSIPVPLDRAPKNSICEDFFSCINIDGSGNVGGCNRQRFDIHDKGKYWDRDVWNNPYFVTERRKFLDDTLKLDEPCTVCFANSAFVEEFIKTAVGD